MTVIKRKETRQVKIGKVKLGGNNSVRIQSMCNTETKDVKATVKQIHQLEEVGCELVRVAIPDMESARSVKKIKKQISIPLIADIHYDYELALECLKQVNPGNISKDKLKIIVREAKNIKIPIRIGINIGSLPKEIVKKFGYTAKAMVKSALETIKLFEGLNFYNTIVSLKSSDILQTIEANTLFSEKSDYPIHLGINY